MENIKKSVYLKILLFVAPLFGSFLFVIFIVTLFSLNIFGGTGSGSGISGDISFYSKSGDALYDGSYTRSDFIKVVESYDPPTATHNGHTTDWGYDRFFVPNAGNFFDIATSYGLDPRFIFCIGIHESYFGTSNIALSKGNFFGWGAYDSSPYESALTFYDMSNGIETVSKGLSKNYVSESGAYYNTIKKNGKDPTTIAGIGTVYASDKKWADSVKKHMVNIFNVNFENNVAVVTNLKKLSSYPLNGKNAKIMNGSLTEFQVNSLKKYVADSILESGYGTGDGVAAAGQALTYGLHQYGYILPYYYGGQYFKVGIPFNSNGKPIAIDCSAFVTWAIINGCNSDFSYHTSTGFYDNITNDTTTIAKAKPGDIMVKYGHVRLVIYSNGSSVITAEEKGRNYGLVFTSHSSMGSGYKILDMSSWYAKNCKG